MGEHRICEIVAPGKHQVVVPPTEGYEAIEAGDHGTLAASALSRRGTRLEDAPREPVEPTAYLGITIPEFPNLFCMYGPGTNLAHGGSLIFHSECQITYIMGCLEQILDGDHRMMEPRPEIHDAYNAHRKSEIDQMVWSHWSIPHTHYKNANGDVFTLSPWPIHTYQQWTKAPDSSEYTFT